MAKFASSSWNAPERRRGRTTKAFRFMWSLFCWTLACTAVVVSLTAFWKFRQSM